MGYRPKTASEKLTFAGTEYEGLEVTVDAAPLGVTLEITEMITGAQQRSIAETMKALRDMATAFGGVLESWNVEHPKTGEPVPATAEGLMSLDPDFVLFVIQSWLVGTAEADEELGKDSPSGGTSGAELIPMEPLSPAPPSSLRRRS